MKNIILAAAALSCTSLAAVPALAQSSGAADTRTITGYGTLGYSHRDNGDTLGAATGRLGLRAYRFLGAEVEGSFGVNDKEGTRAGLPYRSEWKRSVAAYAVGFVPVTPQLDLFARVGLGNTKLESSLGATTVKVQRDTVNYGGGAQFFFTGNDGVRAEFTREDYRNGPGRADVWGAAYVRKF